MKEQVLEVLRDRSAKPHKKFNAAISLYMRHPRANPVLTKHYNRVGVSPESLKNLCYDLQQLYGIRDSELRAKQSDSENLRGSKESDAQLSELLLKELQEIDLETANYASELKPLANEVAGIFGVELENQKKATMVEFLGEQKEKVSKKETPNPFDDASEDAKTGLKLREEFPFLYEDDCPDKLKILVADKISAYEKVLEARKELFKDQDGKELSEEEILHICKSAVENFELNALIYKELNYYKEEGKILGEHPIFAEEVLKREVNELSTNEAHKAFRNLATYISKEKKTLGKAKSEESKAKIQAKIDEFQTKRDLIAKKLGFDEK